MLKIILSGLHHMCLFLRDHRTCLQTMTLSEKLKIRTAFERHRNLWAFVVIVCLLAYALRLNPFSSRTVALFEFADLESAQGTFGGHIDHANNLSIVNSLRTLGRAKNEEKVY